MISQTSRYALRAVLQLALWDGMGRPVPAADLAEALALPANYLSKILHALVRPGVLRSERGPGGGFRLARAPAEISIADVVGTFQELGETPTCLLGRPECCDEDACPVHGAWKEVSRPVWRFFRETTMEGLLEATAPAGRA